MRANPILLLAGAAAVSLCAHTVFAEGGLPLVQRLDEEKARILAQSAELQTENERLADEAELLREPGPYLEKVVRDELGYVREDELVFHFEDDE